MSIANISPAANATLETGDSFSCEITHTSATEVEVTVDGILAWSYTGGYVAGYEGTKATLSEVTTISIAKTAGWGDSPMVVSVTITGGAEAGTTSWSYYVGTGVEYPEGTQEYDQTLESSLRVLLAAAEVEDNILTIDIDDASMNVVKTGTGRVKLFSTGAGVSDHGSLTGLADDDHTQYVLADGTRTQTNALLTEAAAPSAPSAGYVKVYAKTDGLVYSRDSIGIEQNLSADTQAFASWTVSSIAGATTSAQECSFDAANWASITEIKLNYESFEDVVDEIIQSFEVNDFLLLRNAVSGVHMFVKLSSVTDDSGNSQMVLGVTHVGSSGTWAADDVADVMHIKGGSAIHTDVAGEINGLTAKSPPVSADVLAIEDSAASYAKKKVTISDIVSLASAATNTVGFATWSLGSVAGATTSAQSCSFDTATASSLGTIKLNYEAFQDVVDQIIQSFEANDFLLVRTVGGAPHSFVKITGVTDDSGNSQMVFTVSVVAGSGTFSTGTENIDVVHIKGAHTGGGGGGSGTKTLAPFSVVSGDGTEVVIGGGYIDGSTGGTYSWNVTATYNDGGGAGNQDLYIYLYDMGPDGTPTSGTLRSTLLIDTSVVGLDTMDYVNQALTAAASPGTDADEIQNAARMYEVRAKVDATGSLDSGTILYVEFVEA